MSKNWSTTSMHQIPWASEFIIFWAIFVWERYMHFIKTKLVQKFCLNLWNYPLQKEREAYEVIVKSGKLVYKQSGIVLDTPEGTKWIFVLSTSRNFYVGEKKKGLFQHSSFLAGGATIAAGRLVANNGILEVCHGIDLRVIKVLLTVKRASEPNRKLFSISLGKHIFIFFLIEAQIMLLREAKTNRPIEVSSTKISPKLTWKQKKLTPKKWNL